MANLVVVKNNTAKVLNAYRQKGRSGVYRMGQDVLKAGGRRTPMMTRKLRRLTSVKQTGDKTSEVKWSAEYAAAQNLGHRRGARPFQHYTTPGTGSGFVQTGVDYVKKRYKEYFK